MNFLFKFYRPSGIVISNDHCYDTLILIHLANKYKLPSIYIQHASVGDYFPKLSMSLALLEGEDAKQVYLKRGSDAEKIRLIGMPKFDNHFSSISTRTKIETIGLALNGLEDLAALHHEVARLANHYRDTNIIIRPHPILYTRGYKKEYQELVRNLKDIENITYSDSRIENPWTFLEKIDVQIAGDTSIHLEAALLNIASIYYSNNKYYYSLDIYRFNKNNLIPYFQDFDELIKYIDAIKTNRPPIRHKAQYYCSTVETKWDGKSLTLAAYYINNYLKTFPVIPSDITFKKENQHTIYV